MKKNPNPYKKPMIVVALLCVLSVVIAINLLVTGGKPAVQAEQAAALASPQQSAEPTPAPVLALETPAPVEAAPDESATPEPVVKTGAETFSMRFVGDLMCCNGQMEDALQPDGSYDFAKHFAQIKTELQGADVLLGNFEACMYDAAPLNGSIEGFNAPIDYPETLKDIGFNVLFTSNNHGMDFLAEGAFETKQKLQDLGFVTLGTNLTKEEVGSVYIRDVKGVPVAILAYTGSTNKYKITLDGEDAKWVMNYYSTERLTQDVATARALGAKVIVMYLHDGVEKETEPSRRQLAAANDAAALGVDAIVMSHTHSLEPMEKRTVTVDGVEKTVFIAYSLGNFMSSAIHTESLNNIILNIDFTYDWDQDKVTALDASYVLTYTYNYYSDQKIMTYSVVPLQQALSNFAMVDSRTRYSQERFQAAYDKMIKRIGTDAAENVISFHPLTATPAPTVAP